MNIQKSLIHLFGTSLILCSFKAYSSDIKSIAAANGLDVSNRTVTAIQNASRRYGIDAAELTAIGIVETGLGKYNTVNVNQNGTIDEGIFQINTVNKPYCVEYNLQSTEGNAMCAAKLLEKIKRTHSDYVGRYHSNTPIKKMQYLQKITKVLTTTADK